MHNIMQEDYKKLYTEGGESMNRIKEIRESKNISQTILAHLVGVSQPYMHDLENGKRGARPETYQRIAEVLDVPVYELTEKAG